MSVRVLLSPCDGSSKMCALPRAGSSAINSWSVCAVVASAVAVGAVFAAWLESVPRPITPAPVTFSATLEQGGFGNTETFWRSQSKGGGAFSGGFSGSGSVSGAATLSNLGAAPANIEKAFTSTKPTRSGVYRTLCVRLCDGYYFPVKAATSSATFDDDEETCRSSCSSPARLYYYVTDTGTPEEMIDTSGRLYSELPTAFAYRTSYDAACTCRANPWRKPPRISTSFMLVRRRPGVSSRQSSVRRLSRHLNLCAKKLPQRMPQLARMLVQSLPLPR